MTGVLSGMRVVEGSAFVAAPTCGMTLAQLGADVIRFDMIGGGIDYRRWPVTAEGNLDLLGRAEQGQALDRGRFPQARRPGDPDQFDHPAGRGSRHPADEFPDARLARLRHPESQARRPDRAQHPGQPGRVGGGGLHGPRGGGVPVCHRAWRRGTPGEPGLPGWDVSTGYAAATGLLGAERHRRITGEGQYVSLSLADMAFATVGNLGYIGEVQINGTSRPHIGNDVYGSFGRDFPPRTGGR